MYFRFATIFLTTASLAICDLGDANQNEKFLTKRGIIDVFSGNPKFQSVFWNQNPDEPLATKFLGHGVVMPTMSNKDCDNLQYPLPLEEATPIKYETDFSEDVQDDTTSSEEEDTGDGEIIVALNPINNPVNVINLNHSEDGTVENNKKDDHKDKDIYIWTTTEDPRFNFYFEHEQKVELNSHDGHNNKYTEQKLELNSDDGHNNKYTVTEDGTDENNKKEDQKDRDIYVWTSTEYPRFNFYFEHEQKLEQNSDSGDNNKYKVTEDEKSEDKDLYFNLNTPGKPVSTTTHEPTTKDSFFFVNESKFQSETASEKINTETNNLVENKDQTIFISHGFTEQNQNKMNVSNLLLSEANRDEENNESISQKTKVTSEVNGHQIHDVVNKHHTENNKVEDLDNSVLYTSSVYGTKPSSHSFESNSVHQSLNQIDMSLERINNILDRLQEKTYNLQKMIQNHNRPSDHHIHFGEDRNYHRYPYYNNGHHEQGYATTPKRTGSFKTFSKWVMKTKNALANMLRNSFDEEDIKKTSTMNGKGESPQLPREFPKEEAVVIPSNLYINDSPLGPLREKDVKTLRSFFDNDFGRRTEDDNDNANGYRV